MQQGARLGRDMAGSETAERGAPALARPRAVLLGALIIGFVIEALIHGQPVGYGFGVAGIVVVAGWLIVARMSGARVSPSALGLLVYAAVILAMVGVRASPWLQAMNIVSGMAAILIIADIFIPGGLARLSIVDYVLRTVLSGVASLVGALMLVFSDLPADRRAGPERASSAWGPVARGLLLALPLLIVFGALFAAADPVFAGYVRWLFDWPVDLAELIGRLILSLMLAWLAAGLLRHALAARGEGLPGLRPDAVDMRRPETLRIGAPEAMIVLGLLDALFLSFIIVQAVYLFGGADTLARGNLTYSQYARQGFFELVFVAALVLTVVLGMDWLTRPRLGRGRVVIRLMEGGLVAMTLAILVSALQRMRLYQQEFGLTELRFYTTVFMAWLALVLLWLIVTVLSRVDEPAVAAGRRRFAFGAVVAGLALLLAVNLLNPDAFIARTNLARSYAGIGQRLDSIYLTETLSADAVPTLMAWLPAVPDEASVQRELTTRLRLEKARLMEGAERRSWRGMTLGHSRALRALQSLPPPPR